MNLETDIRKENLLLFVHVFTKIGRRFLEDFRNLLKLRVAAILIGQLRTLFFNGDNRFPDILVMVRYNKVGQVIKLPIAAIQYN
jgi:hypothetical protein